MQAHKIPSEPNHTKVFLNSLFSDPPTPKILKANTDKSLENTLINPSSVCFEPSN